MQYRPLGRSEIQVPVVILGAWAIGGWYWGASDDDEAVRALQVGIDAGMNAIDTAPVYGFGHSERVIARALKGRRDQAIVMTKVGLVWDDDRGEVFFETVDQHGIARVVRRNLRPWSIRQEVEHSLKRMEIDVIDVIQCHWPDPTTPIADTLGGLLELRRRGLVRAIGVSNFTPRMMADAQAVLGDVPLASDQPKYSLVAREIEKDVVPHCRQHGVGIVVYSPLEQGLLTGKVPAERSFAATEGRHKRPTFGAQNRARVNAVLESVVRPIAEKHEATLGQVVLAWTFSQPGITSAIAGTRTAAQARENAAAGDLKLDPSELASVRAAFEALKLELPEQAGGSLAKRVLRKLFRR